MNNAAVISGSYADLKFIKTRSVVQLIIECPIEQGNEIVRTFGTPVPGTEVHVAVARLDPEKMTAALPAKERRPWADLPPAQQAAIRCAEPAFQKYVHATDEAHAANYVRACCGVRSRRDIKLGTGAADTWDRLDEGFRYWLNHPDLPHPASPPAHSDRSLAGAAA